MQTLAQSRLVGSARAVRALQQRRLRAVLAAAAKTRFYGDQLSDAAVAQARLDAVAPTEKEAFTERLGDTLVDPSLTKAHLLDFVRQPERAGELLDGAYVVAMTSGTTGQVGIFVNDLESWARTRGVTFARIFRHRMRGRDLLSRLRPSRYKMAFVVATGGHFMTSILASRMPSVGKLFAQPVSLSIEMPIEALVARLNALKPDLLHSYPTVLELLCAEARAGRLRIQPDIITSGSEPMKATCRQAIAASFPRSLLVETYAATECVAMGTSCEHGHLHINEDACILEPVDDQNRPVGPGEVADRVLVTNLLNTAQPLLRYALTDQVEELPGRCPCGSPFRRLRVHGRTDDTFYLQTEVGAYQAHPPIPMEIVFLQVPGLLQYQLIHERQNQLRVLFVSEADADGAQVARVLGEQLSRYLNEHGLRNVDYTLEEVDGIERHSDSRKVRQILSRVERPQADATVSSAQQVRDRRGSGRQRRARSDERGAR